MGSFGAYYIAAQALHHKQSDSELVPEERGVRLRPSWKVVVRRVLNLVRYERRTVEYERSKRGAQMEEPWRIEAEIEKLEKNWDRTRMVRLAMAVQPALRDSQMISSIRGFITRLKCCEVVDAAVRQQLPTVVQFDCLEKGRYVVKQGHQGESYYMLVSGSVDVIIETDEGVLKQVNVLRSGQGFGENALVNKGPRTATIRTREPTELLRIDSVQFYEVLRASKLQEMARKQSFLSSHPNFTSLSEEAMRRFVENASIKSYKTSEMVVRSGEEASDHVYIVMSGECFAETAVTLDHYQLRDGRFLLDLPSVATRPDIARYKKWSGEAGSESASSGRTSAASPFSTTSTLRSDYTTTSSTRSHPRAKIAEQPTSKYREYFTNDVKTVSLKKYHLCLRRIGAGEYFSVSDFLAQNRCSVGAVKKVECLVLPKIVFQKNGLSHVLEEMGREEQRLSLTIEVAFETFLKQRHWELYKRKLVKDVVKQKRSTVR